MVGKSKSATKAEKDHMDVSKRYISCIPCILVGYVNSPADYHHIVEGHRLGHMAGFTMCLYHHRGERDCHWQSLTMQEMHGKFGPSFKLSKRSFKEFFGTELLLVKVHNFALRLYKRYQWNELEMSQFVGIRIRSYHFDLMRKGA